MKMPTGGHLNRTGMALAPQLAAELIEGTEATHPSAQGSAQRIAQVRIEYARQGHPVGSIPPPTTIVGSVVTAKAVLGDTMLVLVDKLGERLAFERTGTRLYDGVISKHDAFGSWEGGPSRKDLEHIREEEYQHFIMLDAVVRELGGDPTAVTPAADIQAVASQGICAVVSDPRANLQQSLEAILTAELVDNDCWENLSDLSRALGRDDFAERFDEALMEEREHLAKVRHWLGVELSTSAIRSVAPEFEQRERERLWRGSGDDAPPLRPSSTFTSASAGATKGRTKNTSAGKSAGKSAAKSSARPAKKSVTKRRGTKSSRSRRKRQG